MNITDYQNHQQRKDFSNDLEFKRDISIRTKREKILFYLWINKVIEEGEPVKEVYDNGSDNDGSVIYDTSQISKRADYSILVNSCEGDRKVFIDVKASHRDFLTLKEQDILYYLEKYEYIPFYIVGFLNTGMLSKTMVETPSKNTEWFLLNINHLRLFLDVLPIKLYKYIGNKPGILVRRPFLIENKLPLKKLYA